VTSPVDAMLAIEDVTVAYAAKRGQRVHAVNGLSLHVAPGEAYGLVGESGCGKSTLVRSAVRLVKPNSGRIAVDGVDVWRADAGALAGIRRDMQMVFQDPYASLNPRLSVGYVLAEPLHLHRLVPRAAATERVAAALAEVGLPADAAQRYPHEFSGGQRQRIGIARALMTGPRLLIADEPVAALDVSVQAGILALLRTLQAQRGLTLLMVAHDLGVVRFSCDRVGVMYLGRIVEEAAVPAIFDSPLHPFTQLLRAASPVPEIGRKQPLASSGEPPSPLAPPSGCAFHPRCPIATSICRIERPILRPASPGRLVACHHAFVQHSEA
jgi:peptide/nickel transport system ATP-binding protein